MHQHKRRKSHIELFGEHMGDPSKLQSNTQGNDNGANKEDISQLSYPWICIFKSL